VNTIEKGIYMKNFGFKDVLVSNLKKQGINTPTPIQNLTIESILDGNDLMAEAQTGTGKTLAFLLPIFQKLDTNNPNVQAVVLTPTRELAIQITSEAKKLAENTDFNVLAVFGGQDFSSQLRKMKTGIHLIVATPGRLIDHIGRGTVDLSSINTFVLDEADQMLHIGFKNEVETILKATNSEKQVLCFSATLDSKVKKLAYKHMVDPLEFSVAKKNITLDTIKQKVIFASDRQKQDALLKELDKINPFLAIIFCRTKRRADKLEMEMSIKKYNCNKLHGSMTQSSRQRVMKSFRDAKIQYLIATDVAARGLDITGVSHIFNYDIPETPETYIHRIGRTGRMGESGVAITFVAPKDVLLLQDIEKEIKMKIPKEDYVKNSSKE
jgi:superfamily II DNA/RNA helicase